MEKSEFIHSLAKLQESVEAHRTGLREGKKQ